MRDLVIGILTTFLQSHISHQPKWLASVCLSLNHLPYFLFPSGNFIFHFIFVVLVQLLIRIQLFVTPWTAACLVSLSFTISQSLLKLMSIESVMLSKHLILYQPLSSCPQYFPALGSFPMNQFFASGGQIIGASASASVLPVTIPLFGYYS